MVAAQKTNINLKKTVEKETLFRESFIFVLDLIQYTELLRQKKKKSLAKQLLKSGTCFGKIINEARFTEDKELYFSKIQKLKTNAQNVKYLLQLCKYSATYPNPTNLISDLEQLINQILTILQTKKSYPQKLVNNLGT